MDDHQFLIVEVIGHQGLLRCFGVLTFAALGPLLPLSLIPAILSWPIALIPGSVQHLQEDAVVSWELWRFQEDAVVSREVWGFLEDAVVSWELWRFQEDAVVSREVWGFLEDAVVPRELWQFLEDAAISWKLRHLQEDALMPALRRLRIEKVAPDTVRRYFWY
ncbi:hypothetical protein GCM10010404_43760 [Nonomuraea africana]